MGPGRAKGVHARKQRRPSEHAVFPRKALEANNPVKVPEIKANLPNDFELRLMLLMMVLLISCCPFDGARERGQNIPRSNNMNKEYNIPIPYSQATVAILL